MTKFSDRVTQMQSSPIRRLTPFALKAQAEGIKVLYTNIGQPDILTPPAFAEGVRTYLDSTRSKPVAYGPSEGLLPFRAA
ncbi:MAG: pyridoxal phosphate-dependent aminotransferase, partial [Sphaerochaetaceae bacterium]